MQWRRDARTILAAPALCRAGSTGLRITWISSRGPRPSALKSRCVAGMVRRVRSVKPRGNVMSYSLSQAALPVFEIGLNALSAVLDKGAAFAAGKKVAPEVLAQYRLAPDMFPLARQVQIACDQAKNGSARLAGIEPPKFEDNETTIDQLKARIAKTVDFVKSVQAKALDGAGDREITFPLGPT